MNPFNPGTASYNDFNVLSDLKWHCTKCELESGQAKTWQVWRQKGIQLDVDEKNNLYKKIYCGRCKKKVIHRKLKSLDVLEDTTERSGLPQVLAKRIKLLLKFEEAVFVRKMPPRELEVDHKFPQIRWNKNESENNKNMSEEEIRLKFILLTRSNNLLKSRGCEKCFKTKKRGNFPGIYFWYAGKETWDENIEEHSEAGCIGCFWNNPNKWREELNKLINKKS